MDTIGGNEILNLIKEQIAAIGGFDVSDVNEDQSFLKMGISSIKTFMITNRISDKLGIDLDPTVMLEYKNISSLYEYIIDHYYYGELE